MANYFKTIDCPVCGATLGFEDVSNVYEEMRVGLCEHLKTHASATLQDTVVNLAFHSSKEKLINIIVKEKLGDKPTRLSTT